MTTKPIAAPLLADATSGWRIRGYQIAWGLALCFYFLEYASRSAPAVMIGHLVTAFGTSAIGVSAILGTYYYTYSTTSLIAGAALDRVGAKKAVPVGIFILAIGCLLFSVPTAAAGYAGRLLQGAGSAFAFTGAVYLAAHGFSARWLATAIGVTQCLGMLGGSAGQFVVGPWIEHATIDISGRVKGHTSMALRFDRLVMSDGRRAPIHAEVVELYHTPSGEKVDVEGAIESGGRGRKTIEHTAIGAGAGALLGGIFGGGKGAGIGSIIGGVGGLGTTAFHGHQKITLGSGQEMLIRITSR
jgi:hypothetical protein